MAGSVLIDTRAFDQTSFLLAYFSHECCDAHGSQKPDQLIAFQEKIQIAKQLNDEKLFQL